MNKAVNHRNMRLLLILILSILSLVLCMGNSSIRIAFAQDPNIPQVTAESKTVHRGQTFSIDVTLAQNTGLISLFLTIDYDESVMVLKNVVQGSALNTLTLTTTNIETEKGYGIEPFNILWDGKDSDSTNGVIVTFIFDSFIDAPVGDYPVTLTYDKQNTNIAYQTPTDISITNGVVTLITGEYEAIYRDYDGTILYQRDYNENDIPAYPSSLPEPFRDEDDEYSYEFVGWKGMISDDINVLIFEADYKFIPQIYSVFFYVDGINGLPDGIIDETEDYFWADEVPFGEVLEIPQVPDKQYYQFYGWYTDDSFQTESTYAKMPSKNIRLYGYYSFDVRERNIPVISLDAEFIDDSLEDVVVTAELLINPGFNGLVLTLQYDHDVFIFDHFEALDLPNTMQFDTTNIEYMDAENFKFYFESATNFYGLGDFLKLYFKVKPDVPENVYKISFTYDYHTDATYINNKSETKYTMVEFYDAEVPIGEINHWLVNVGEGRMVDVTSETGKPINVYLEVNLVTDNITLDESLIRSQVGRGMYLSSAYKITLMQNNQEIQPNTTLVIKVKLTEKEKRGKIKFYYLNDNNELSAHEFQVEDGKLVFTTNHLSNWVIFNNYRENSGDTNMLSLVGFPIILAIATMLYALRLKQMNNKNDKGGTH